MSVVASKRRRSKLDVIDRAERLQDLILDLTQRNFGAFSRKVHLRTRFTYGNYDSEVEVAKRRLLLQEYSRQVHQIVTSIIGDLRAANAIYPVVEQDYNMRRFYQTQALSECDVLEGKLNSIANEFDVDISKYAAPINHPGIIKHEIRKWRSSDTRRRKELTG